MKLPIIIPAVIYDQLSVKTRTELDAFNGKILTEVFGPVYIELQIISTTYRAHLNNVSIILTDLCTLQAKADKIREYEALKSSLSTIKKHLGDL